MSTPPFRSAASNYAQNSSGGAVTVTVSRPAGAVAGDLLIAHVVALGATIDPIAGPDGWDLLYDGSVQSGNQGHFVHIYARKVDGSTPSSFQFDRPNTGNNGISASISCYIGASIDPHVIDGDGAIGTLSSIRPPGESTTDPAQIVIFYSVTGSSSNVMSTPTGTTQRAYQTGASQNHRPETLSVDFALDDPGDIGRPVAGSTSQRWAAIVLALVMDNAPPHAPTITSPVAGQTWARNEPNRVGIGFNDPDPGDTQSGNGGAVRLAGETEPYYVWDGETPNEWHDIPAGELLAGDNELHAWSYDSQGEVGPPSDWVPFTVADRPGPPSIVDPINGATIPTQTYPVVISAASLEAARYRRYADVDGTIDPETVYQDETVNSSTSRQKTLNFPVNQRWEWIGAIRKRDGLWSNDEALHRVWVSWTAPAEPTVTVAIHEDMVDGRMMPVGFAITAAHPTPDEELEEPAVTHMDVWRAIDDGTGQPIPGSEEQLQLGTALAPAATFVDASVRSGVPYLYRVRAWGTNGVYTDAPWAG